MRRELTAARPWVAYAALAAGVVCVGWSALFVRWAAVPGPASALYRVVVAAAVLVPLRALHRPRGADGRPAALPTRRDAGFALLAGAFFALDLALYNTAVLRTSAATATLLGNNAPLLVALGVWLLFRERPPPGFWPGLALALAGCVAMIGGDVLRAGATGGAGAGDLVGDLMAVVASVFFAAYLITNHRVRAAMDTLTFTTLAIVGSVTTLLVVCLALRVPLGGYDARTWAALVGLGLVTQLGGYLAITYALGHLPPTVTSVGLLGQSPLTALLAVLLLAEPLHASQVAGGALVLLGIWVVNRTARSRELAAAESGVAVDR